jgi:mannose-6-phosphate isomerase-like protein (cupin superfamily)
VTLGKKRATPHSRKPPFVITDFRFLRGKNCPCGISRRAFTRKDNRACTLHLVSVKRDAASHYHRRLTEVYYFLEGRGQIELNGKRYRVRPGIAILIRPGTRHRAVSGGRPMKILNVVVPGFDPRDEWFDGDREAGT